MNSTNLPEMGNVSAVSSAQLIQSVRHSEMRLGMQSEEFGSMSISTSLSKQVLSAQISTEHAELGRALMVHLPAMEQKLSTAYGVPAKVEVHGGTSSLNTSTDTSSRQQPQGGRKQGSGGGSPAVSLSTDRLLPVAGASYPAQPADLATVSRLDIRI